MSNKELQRELKTSLSHYDWTIVFSIFLNKAKRTRNKEDRKYLMKLADKLSIHCIGEHMKRQKLMETNRRNAFV